MSGLYGTLPIVNPAGTTVAGQNSLPLTGNELFEADTQLSAGGIPESELISIAQARLFTPAISPLVDGATIPVNASLAEMFTVTLAGNRTLSNPTNLVAGKVFRVEVTQDATGSRTLAYGTLYKWPAGTAPTLTTTAGAVDILTFVYDGTILLGSSSLNVH